MKITRERWDQIERHLNECGYMALTDADQAACDAWDKGTLKFSTDDDGAEWRVHLDI